MTMHTYAKPHTHPTPSRPCPSRPPHPIPSYSRFTPSSLHPSPSHLTHPTLAHSPPLPSTTHLSHPTPRLSHPHNSPLPSPTHLSHPTVHLSHPQLTSPIPLLTSPSHCAPQGKHNFFCAGGDGYDLVEAKLLRSFAQLDQTIEVIRSVEITISHAMGDASLAIG